MLKINYQPKEGSIGDKVLGWLECNGGGVSMQDIVKIFRLNGRNSAGHYVEKCVEAGLLVYHKDKQPDSSGRLARYYTLPGEAE